MVRIGNNDSAWNVGVQRAQSRLVKTQSEGENCGIAFISPFFHISYRMISADFTAMYVECSNRKSGYYCNQTFAAVREIKVQKWIREESGEAGRLGTN